MLLEGTLFDNTYRLIRLVGEGAMGAVYEATHARLEGRYVIKVLQPSLSKNAESLALFHLEARITSLLQHPNIVQVVDHNTTAEGIEYLVMEYLAGETLADRLVRTGALPLDTVVGIVEQIAAGLAAAHAHGIVHRDLKPDNVFLVPVEGREAESVKILDFGISKVKDPSWGRQAPEGTVMGTPLYMSPEQVEGRVADVDDATDQFALAVIAYEMLTGRNPFQADSISDVFSMVLHSDPAPMEVGRDVELVVRRAGQVEPPAVSHRHGFLRRASRRGGRSGARDPAVGDGRVRRRRGRQPRAQTEIATAQMGPGPGRRGGGEHVDLLGGRRGRARPWTRVRAPRRCTVDSRRRIARPQAGGTSGGRGDPARARDAATRGDAVRVPPPRARALLALRWSRATGGQAIPEDGAVRATSIAFRCHPVSGGRRRDDARERAVAEHSRDGATAKRAVGCSAARRRARARFLL